MESQNKFLSLATEFEVLKEQYKKKQEELNSVMADLGIGAIFQDAETGLVFKIVKPSGTYVSFKEIDYVRTAKEGEKAGSLSKKEAEEKGFDLKKGGVK